jgi:hypothetical protein
VTAPLCAMWQGRCGNPAHLVVEATKRINGHDEPVNWFCCDDLRCILASQSHAAEFGVIHVDSRPIDATDIDNITRQMAVTA